MLDMATNPKTCGSLCSNRTRELEVLILAANEFERVIAGDPDSQGGGSHIWKNAGIAYSRIIQGKFPPEVMSAYERPDAYHSCPTFEKKWWGRGGQWMDRACELPDPAGVEAVHSHARCGTGCVLRDDKNVVAYLSETDEQSSTGQAGGVSGQTTADNDAPKQLEATESGEEIARKKRKRKSKSRKNRQNK